MRPNFRQAGNIDFPPPRLPGTRCGRPWKKASCNVSICRGWSLQVPATIYSYAPMQAYSFPAECISFSRKMVFLFRINWPMGNGFLVAAKLLTSCSFVPVVRLFFFSQYRFSFSRNVDFLFPQYRFSFSRNIDFLFPQYGFSFLAI
jgi:hypothetical protein